MVSDLFRPNAYLKVAVEGTCQNACDICLNRKTKRAGAVDTQDNKNLKPADILTLLNQAKKLGFFGFYATGGEPFLSSFLPVYINAAAKLGLESSVVSNLGAIGASENYLNQHRALFERAGLADLSIAQRVSKFVEAGLGRLYASVDYAHSDLNSSGKGNKVPVNVIADALSELLKQGFGERDSRSIISYKLRVSSTASGEDVHPTLEIINEIVKRVGLQLKEENAPSPDSITRIYYHPETKGIIYYKLHGTFDIGNATNISPDRQQILSLKDIFNLYCPLFLPRENAYPEGHQDLAVNSDGTVYTCGDFTIPIGNIFESSLDKIIIGVNNDLGIEKYNLSVRVYHRLLRLSQIDGFGANAMGKAMLMIHTVRPDLLKPIHSEGQVCGSLGANEEMQKTFIEQYDTIFGQ